MDQVIAVVIVVIAFLASVAAILQPVGRILISIWIYLVRLWRGPFGQAPPSEAWRTAGELPIIMVKKPRKHSQLPKKNSSEPHL